MCTAAAPWSGGIDHISRARWWTCAIAVAVANSTVAAFNLFDEAWVLTASSIDTRPILTQIYLETFQNLHFSYGMALSLVLTAVSLLVSLIFVVRIYTSTRLE